MTKKNAFFFFALVFNFAPMGCKTTQNMETGETSSSVSNAGKSLSLVGSGKLTTHYCSAINALPPNQKQYYNPKMGPGHFHCGQFNGAFNDSSKNTGLYVALSDQIKEINWCNGSQCYTNDSYCGKQVKISCNPSRGDQHCNPNAQALTVMVVDFCPMVHPDRKPGQTPPYCGDGQTVADLSDWVWDHFRAPGNENNLRLTFEKVGW